MLVRHHIPMPLQRRTEIKRHTGRWVSSIPPNSQARDSSRAIFNTEQPLLKLSPPDRFRLSREEISFRITWVFPLRGGAGVGRNGGGGLLSQPARTLPRLIGSKGLIC